MPTSGSFKGIETKVDESMGSVQLVLSSYPTSQAGKNSYSNIEGFYYKWLAEYFKEVRSAGSDESKVFMDHLVGRLHLNDKLLAVALMRVFRRVLYCKSFNAMELNQMKQAGLYAYWLTKLHPIIINEPSADMRAIDDLWENRLQEINERFAFHLILSVFIRQYGRPGQGIKGYRERFVHAVRFRSFTEDSMMLLVESLGKEAFDLAGN
jgi:hypothetical protein